MVNLKQLSVGTLLAIIVAVIGFGAYTYFSNARTLNRPYPLDLVSSGSRCAVRIGTTRTIGIEAG